VKNLKVRMKILLAFVIVIVLILALSIYIVIANVTTNENAQMLRDKTQMQSLCTTLVDQFSQANAQINIINYTFDDNAAASVMEHMGKCQSTLEEILGYINQNPSLNSLLPAVGNVGACGEAWSGNVAEILALNGQLASIIADARKDTNLLKDQSSGIVDYQIELSNDEATQDIESSARLRRVSRVEQGIDIANRLNTIANSYELMFVALDVTNTAENKAFFDETVDVLTAFHDESALQYNIDTSEAMLVALSDYERVINDFISTITKRENLLSAGETLSVDALTAVGSLVSMVEASSMNNADTMINSGSVTLIVTIVIVIVAIFLSIFLALYLSGLISKPLTLLAGFMNKAGTTGDISLSPQDVETIQTMSLVKDEIGQAISGSALFVQHVTTIASVLESVASGDLSVDISILSDLDVLGVSIKRTLENLNSMFTEIAASSNQVSSGAKQVANGAQMLAQGSTEQAASIQQLSSSITEISDRIKENAVIADRTSKLSATIKENAEKGSLQMDEMITAVSDINEASRNIGKIIKTIDDIAFQTNILALNAAVEAARAGQHGKGFAVVAEEVRNLASKSADAAKDTGDLIQDSMDKAELGARIAGETAASLTEIVTGINESGILIADITKASEEQSMGISQINIGIDQVAQVVQQNSATAEESAAASEEMSGQSDTMRQLVTQFKLKGGGSVYIESPAAKKSYNPARISATETHDYSYPTNDKDFGKY